VLGESPQREMVTIKLNGIETEVPKGQLLIEAAEQAGTYIPRFCYQKRLKPVGLCRMCLVEVEGPRGTALVPSCTQPCGEGMVVDTENEVVHKAQEGVLEFLLLNHPLDCPVCDKGGECPLQDHTVAYGPGESRFVEEKRHYEKPIEISDLILLDRERCILCARCTRFCDEISGDSLIEFVDRGNGTQVLTFFDEPFASYFSGNTVQICPVGALTAKPFRFRARPWDLEAIESVSMVDSVGSKVSVQTSQNQMLRINGVDSDTTNHGWLSDKDRFTHQAVHADGRLTMPLVRKDGDLVETSWGEALDLVAERLGSVRGDQVAGLGAAHSTNEEAYAFAKFLRSIVVTPHIDAQLDDALADEFLAASMDRAKINDLETAKTILLWAGDLKEELPVLYLRVRRAATILGATLIVVHPRRTGLSDVADYTLTYRPGEGADALRRLKSGDGMFAEARQALESGPVVAIVGRTGAAEDPRLAESVAAFARTLDGARIMPLARRANVYGALDMGVSADMLPGRVSVHDSTHRTLLEDAWGPLPEGRGKHATEILEGLRDGDLQALVTLGADPIGNHPQPALAAEAVEAAQFVVSLDVFLNATSSQADVVLPVAGFGESEGTATNLEGRVQKLNRIVPPPGQARPTWAVLDDLTQRMGGTLDALSAEVIMKEIAGIAPAYAGIGWELLDWGEGRDGVVLPGPEGAQPLQHMPVETSITATTGRFTLHLGRVLFDNADVLRHSPSLDMLVQPAAAAFHPRDLAVLAVQPGDTVRVAGDYGSVDLPVRVDESLAEGTVYVQANMDGSRALGAPLIVQVDAVRGEDA
jgi:NADH-quinone oxidoreductase subunit G